MKNSTIIAIVIVLAAFGVWYFVSPKVDKSPVIPSAPSTATSIMEVSDTTNVINTDVESIETVDITGDIQSLETDIQGL